MTRITLGPCERGGLSLTEARRLAIQVGARLLAGEGPASIRISLRQE